MKGSKGKLMRRDEGARSFWSTSWIFLTLIVLTVVMILAVKGLVTGSVRPIDRFERPIEQRQDTRATKSP